MSLCRGDGTRLPPGSGESGHLAPRNTSTGIPTQACRNLTTTGRVLTEKRTIAGITKTLSYTYNLDGSMATLKYPSGRVITYGYSHARRPVSAVDSTNSINYALSATYAPQSAVASVIYGQVSGGFTGITCSRAYNNRLQRTFIQATSSNGTVQNLSYSYGISNNGHVMSITNNLNTNRTQNFTYDTLNRVATAKTQGTSGSTCWGQSFGLDRYGNLTSATVTQCSAPTLSLTVNNNNQITNTGFAYDADGNLTGDGSLTYTWDAESRLTTSAGVTYIYDGDGRRVKNTRLYCTVLYWYGINRAPVAESDLSGNITNEYVFFYGTRIARRDSSGNVFYYHADHLSTARVITNATGVTQQESDYYPFGGELVITSGSGNNYKFTGHERDAETGLDHTHFRKYSSNLGRWHSPDPYGASAIGASPQTWNRYTYAVNEPVSLTDPLGLECIDLGNGIIADDLTFPPCSNVTGDQPGEITVSGEATSGEGQRLASDTRSASYGFAANNGPNPVAVANSMRQYVKNSLITVPLQYLKQKTVWYFCGSSPEGAVENWMETGATKGAIGGAIAGAGAMGVETFGFGGVPGAIIGGQIGATAGAGGGVLFGSMDAGVCSADGVYGH